MNDATKSIVISSSKLVEKVLSFGIILIASRHFGSEGIGEFFYYFSTVSLFIPLMDLGFEKLLMQRWWDHDNTERRQIIGNLILLKIICGVLSLVFALGVDVVIRWGSPNPLAILGAFFAIYLDEAGGLFRTPKRVESNFTLDTIVPLLCRIITLILFLMSFGKIVHGYQLVFIYAASNAVGMFISFSGSRGFAPVFSTVTKFKLLELTKAGIPFSMTSLCVMVSLYVDSVMLGHFSIKEVGLYNAAYRIILVMAALSGGTCHVLFPKFIRLKAAGDMEKASDMFFSVLRIHLIIFGSVSIGGIVLGKQLMLALYGDSFVDSGLPFVILSILIVTVSFTNVIGHTLEAFGKQKMVMKITIKAALFNFIANLMVIPLFGMVGAACTTVMTELLTLAIQYRKLSCENVMPWNISRITRGFLFIIMIIPIYMFLPMLNIWLAIALGTITFAAVFFLGKKYWLDGIQQNKESCI